MAHVLQPKTPTSYLMCDVCLCVCFDSETLLLKPVMISGVLLGKQREPFSKQQFLWFSNQNPSAPGGRNRKSWIPGTPRRPFILFLLSILFLKQRVVQINISSDCCENRNFVGGWISMEHFCPQNNE